MDGLSGSRTDMGAHKLMTGRYQTWRVVWAHPSVNECGVRKESEEKLR